MAKDANIYAMGIDIDGAGLLTMALHGKDVEPKTIRRIKRNKVKN